MKLECASCGAVYPGDFNKSWGRTKETSGYGPQMVCVAIVPTSQAKDAPGEVCRGMLGAVPDSAARTAALVPLTPIGS